VNAVLLVLVLGLVGLALVKTRGRKPCQWTKMQFGIFIQEAFSLLT